MIALIALIAEAVAGLHFSVSCLWRATPWPKSVREVEYD